MALLVMPPIGVPGVDEEAAQQTGSDEARPAAVLKSSTNTSTTAGKEICNGEEIDLFKLLCEWIDGPHERKDDESKCEWLRSQVIGAEARIDTPFGRRRLTYSDHTASGRFLQFIEEFLQQVVLPFYGNTHTVDSYVGLHTSSLVQQSSQYIKRCMGAGAHDVLVFCGSGSTAAIKRLQEVTGIVVPSILRPMVLRHLPPSERWVVFVGPYEHHSNFLSWCESLAEVVKVGLDEAGLVDIGALEAALESPEYAGRPKLGSFSACSNVTGIYVDTRAIARVLHRHGAFACFDFACSGPYVDIDMRSGEPDGYDAVFLSPHKFLGGPGTPGILLMSDSLYRIKDTPPSTSGGGTVHYVNGHDEDTVYCKDVEEREDAGTPAIVQKIRAAMAFRVKEWVGDAAIASRESLMARRALERLLADPRVRVLGNTAVDRQPVISFLVYPDGDRSRHLHCRFVTRLLNDLFGIQARGGCACAGPYGHALLQIDRERSKAIKTAVEKGYESIKPGWARVSFAYYSSWEEMEFVLDAIEFLAGHGRSFLPLYSFDWRTGDWDYSGHEKDLLPHLHAGRGSDADGAFADYLAAAGRAAERCQQLRPVERGEIPEAIDPLLVNFIL